jgi:hypothetical protein
MNMSIQDDLFSVFWKICVQNMFNIAVIIRQHLHFTDDEFKKILSYILVNIVVLKRIYMCVCVFVH